MAPNSILTDFDPTRILMQNNRDLWSATFLRFYQQCHQGTDGGRGLNDLDYLATQVFAVIDRIPQASSGISHFENDPTRQVFMEKLVQRTEYELIHQQRISDAEFIRIDLVWALIQVADMSQIDAWNQQLDNIDVVPPLFIEAEDIVHKMRLHFKIFFPAARTKKEVQEISASSAGKINAEKRTRAALNSECLRRDGHRCIISGEDHPQACYIFPDSGGQGTKIPTVQDALTYVYGGTRAQLIKKKLFTDGMINKLGNVVCMSPSFHARWGRGEFALKHHKKGFDKEKKKHYIKLVFYWMKKERPDGTNRSKSAHDFLAAHPREYRRTRAVNVLTNTRIIDGDIITIWADSEDKLPDEDIIDYQWKTIRMASLCGGAEPDEDEENNDEGDEDDEMGSDTDAASDMF